MRPDILLLSTPNKNIDYPGLSLPVLAAALRQRGLTVEQQDLNMVIRDRILTEEGLAGLLESSLPAYARYYARRHTDLQRLLAIQSFLLKVRNEWTLQAVVEVKRRAQSRDYEWIFSEGGRFERFTTLFKINRALHYILDTAVELSYGNHDDYITALVRQYLERTIADIKNKRPLLVGFSVLDIQRAFSRRIVTSLRAEYDGTIALGGADPTRFPMEYMEQWKEIDMVFDREAEVSLPAVINELDRSPVCLDSIPGIYYRDGEGAIRQNRRAPVDLSDIPTPDFRGLPLELYLTPALPVQASRGCYWQKCRFCIHWDTYSDFHVRRAERVCEDIGSLVSQYGTRYFHFTDDCLPVPHARRLVELLQTSGLDVRWLAYFRLEADLDRSMLEAIWRAGGRVLEMGLESASERVLGLMRKNITPGVAKRIVSDAAAVGLLVKLFMFHGYPGERAADLERTIEFTEKMIKERKIRAFYPLRNRFELLRGSDIYETAVGGREAEIARCWVPSGLFGIRAEYELVEEEESARAMVSTFVRQIRGYMRDGRIYSVDDENVMVDLLVLDRQPLGCGWGCL